LITASGHDAPIVLFDEDYYDRWPVATSISRIIESSPLEWSTRIGLFGKWGEGKTSVLNFLDQEQREAGNVVIKYSPWGISNENELWKNFGDALLKGLKENGLAVTYFETACHWLKVRGSSVVKLDC
jgi:predicted KAP-like P-loop ATPase